LLDQENSKRFIRGSPQEKYKFFKQATDLDRIQEHIHAAIHKNMVGAEKIQALNAKLPEWKKHYTELKAQVEAIKGLEGREKEIKTAKVHVSRKTCHQRCIM